VREGLLRGDQLKGSKLQVYHVQEGTRQGGQIQRKYDCELLELPKEGETNAAFYRARAETIWRKVTGVQGEGTSAGSGSTTLPDLQPKRQPTTETQINLGCRVLDPKKSYNFVELCGGCLSGTTAALEVGLKIGKLTLVEPDPKARMAAAATLSRLQAQFPGQFAQNAVEEWDTALGSTMADAGGRLYDFTMKYGAPDFIVAWWPCQGLSKAGLQKGLQDSRTRLIYDVAGFIRRCQEMAGEDTVFYLLENVAVGGCAKRQIQNALQEIQNLVGVQWETDAVRFGSFAHRYRSYWFNFIPVEWMGALETATPRIQRRVQDVLQPIHTVPICGKTDLFPYGVNVAGRPRQALPTFYATLDTYSLRTAANGGNGEGLVLNGLTGLLEPTWASERELAMGFHIHDTASPGLTDSDRCAIIGNAMDRYALRWMFSLAMVATELFCDDFKTK